MKWELWIYEYFKHNKEGSTSKIGEFFRNRTGKYNASAYQIGYILKRLFLKGILSRRDVGLYDDESYSKFIYYMNETTPKATLAKNDRFGIPKLNWEDTKNEPKYSQSTEEKNAN